MSVWWSGLSEKVLSNGKNHSLSLLLLAWPRDVKQSVCLLFCISRKFKTSSKYLTVTLKKEEKDFLLAYSIVMHHKVNVMAATIEVDPTNICGQLEC